MWPMRPSRRCQPMGVLPLLKIGRTLARVSWFRVCLQAAGKKVLPNESCSYMRSQDVRTPLKHDLIPRPPLQCVGRHRQLGGLLHLSSTIKRQDRKVERQARCAGRGAQNEPWRDSSANHPALACHPPRPAGPSYTKHSTHDFIVTDCCPGQSSVSV
jgi:hypothetical protein